MPWALAIVSQLAEKGVEFKVLDDAEIDTSSRTGTATISVMLE
jgi:DNA invertase Pin-like site-specific DNA recombinase